VIHIDLGCAKSSTYEGFVDGVRRAVKQCLEPHRRLLDRSDVRADLKRLFETSDGGNASESDLNSESHQSMMSFLRELLYSSVKTPTGRWFT